MPNYCDNELHVVGPMERVEEFRIFNSQNVDPLHYNLSDFNWHHASKNPDKFPSHALVGDRGPLDFSFRSAVPVGDNSTADSQTASWGTKWDTSHEVWPARGILDRAPLIIPHGESMARSFSVTFDTAWSPPRRWFEKLAMFATTVDIVMAYEERSDGFCGIDSWIQGDHSSDSYNISKQGQSFIEARVTARESMHKKRKPGKLMAAIFSDDVSAVKKLLLSKLLTSPETWGDDEGMIDGMWPPLMYAARAGSKAVFNELLTMEQDPAWRSPCGVGVLDVLMDVFPHQHVDLVKNRYAMIDLLFSKAPMLSVRPLATGITPVEMAVHFSMMNVFQSIITHGGINAIGNKGGWEKAAVGVTNENNFPILTAAMPAHLSPTYIDSVMMRAITKQDVELLRAAFEMNSELSASTISILRGEKPLENGDPAAPVIKSAYAALVASRAIKKVIRDATQRPLSNK
jgi:hypothetical protein